jgi:hypothetical protein
MMAKRARVTEETESAQDDLREEQMNDPKVQARIKEIFEEARKGSTGPGVTAEELAKFLREHGR